ncbi:hydrolase [Streptomyces bathyalis]|uniref:Hydrolase n=1 Tax=Streptomyces bathyalis TaxID=2710756 RepID=A0A7T1WRH0_9ACTN|nr:HAD family acid phosphatase [Streptomyces bathyalis]QPP06132.1 hydrolase [Streptomyces bathyalis]
MHVRKLTTRIAVSAAGAAVATVTAVSATSATAAPAPADSQSARTAATAPAQQQAERGSSTRDDVSTREDVDYETWKRDVSAVTDEARPYLEERISQGAGEKMAIVLDIDNTSLETHFHPIWELPTPPVQQTLDLARYADSRGVDVFFVTARPGIIHSLTKDNLEKAGFPIDGLYLRDLPDIFDEVSKYKTAKRAEIESKGYKIIANIGNTPTDMVGGHAEKTFKLPDYDGALS